ncbi:hypothetical protein E3N88_34956 [Mikania micrantha]|uniref:Uncharacterized protein n=1 Tax=Mikania micrantha TaxID=192012 RepID=A0A5N6M0H6_9ASTR|nr:hypothetical protein E3N88_34956 [Mikania micrantha]
MPPRRQPPLLPLTQGSAPHSSTPTPADSPPPPPPPPPPPAYQLDPATVALATLLTSQLREVIPEMMNRINNNNSNNVANSSGEGSGNTRQNQDYAYKNFVGCKPPSFSGSEVYGMKRLIINKNNILCSSVCGGMAAGMAVTYMIKLRFRMHTRMPR